MLMSYFAGVSHFLFNIVLKDISTCRTDLKKSSEAVSSMLSVNGAEKNQSWHGQSTAQSIKSGGGAE